MIKISVKSTSLWCFKWMIKHITAEKKIEKYYNVSQELLIETLFDNYPDEQNSTSKAIIYLCWFNKYYLNTVNCIIQREILKGIQKRPNCRIEDYRRVDAMNAFKSLIREHPGIYTTRTLGMLHSDFRVLLRRVVALPLTRCCSNQMVKGNRGCDSAGILTNMMMMDVWTKFSAWFNRLQQLWPDYEYHPEPRKRVLVTMPEMVQLAKNVFRGSRVRIIIEHRYLLEIIGTQAYQTNCTGED